MSWDARTFDREWPFDLFATKVLLESGRTALLVVDMQAADMEVASDSELGRRYPRIREYSNARVTSVVLPTIRGLVAGFRAAGLPVVYSRSGPITPHAMETAPRLRPKIGSVYWHRGSPATRSRHRSRRCPTMSSSTS